MFIVDNQKEDILNVCYGFCEPVFCPWKIVGNMAENTMTGGGGRAEAGKDCGLHMAGDLPGIGEALEVSWNVQQNKQMIFERNSNYPNWIWVRNFDSCLNKRRSGVLSMHTMYMYTLNL